MSIHGPAEADVKAGDKVDQSTDVQYFAWAAADAAPGGQTPTQRIRYNLVFANLFSIVFEVSLFGGTGGTGEGHCLQGLTAQGEECFRRHTGAAAAETVAESIGPANAGFAVVQGAPGEGGGISSDQTANFGDRQHGFGPATLPQPGEHGLQFPSKSIAR